MSSSYIICNGTKKEFFFPGCFADCGGKLSEFWRGKAASALCLLVYADVGEISGRWGNNVIFMVPDSTDHYDDIVYGVSVGTEAPVRQWKDISEAVQCAVEELIGK